MIFDNRWQSKQYWSCNVIEWKRKHCLQFLWGKRKTRMVNKHYRIVWLKIALIIWVCFRTWIHMFWDAFSCFNLFPTFKCSNNFCAAYASHSYSVVLVKRTRCTNFNLWWMSTFIVYLKGILLPFVSRTNADKMSGFPFDLLRKMVINFVTVTNQMLDAVNWFSWYTPALNMSISCIHYIRHFDIIESIHTKWLYLFHLVGNL